MGKKPTQYKKLDPELMKEIIGYVIDCVRTEEAKLIQVLHDRKRANIKLTLRKYREIVRYVDKAVYEASQEDDDFTLQDLLVLMSGDRNRTFRVDSIRDSVAKSKIMVDHMNKMLDDYRVLCEHSDKAEDKRRYRVLYNTYIASEEKSPEEIAQEEFVDKSTVYRDIDAAAERLTVLFFGVDGLKFL